MKPIESLRHWCVIGATLVVACASPSEPVPPGGRIVLRFEPTPASLNAGPTDVAAVSATAAFDSVVVRVFRPGGTLVQEVARGAALAGTDPLEMTVRCIAENDKRVSVELFENGVMTHTGANTDVDVVADRSTAVPVDAYSFTIGAMSVSPVIVADGASFTLRWNSAVAAEWYQVQSSPTPDFSTIAWEQAVTDTTLDTTRLPGSHYFRVVPMTQFADGTAAGPEFGYVVGGSGAVVVSGFNPGAVIPGETVTINGENLDFPGTAVWIGGHQCTIESAAWDALVVRLPRNATTDYVSVSNLIGTDFSNDALVMQRVAYVTLSGQYAIPYALLLARHIDDFGYSGVVIISVADLDWRDMGVFDIVIVANDTGANANNWGGNKPSRADAIVAGGSNVLAIGDGGATFMELAGDLKAPAKRISNQTSYYTTTPSAEIFTTPHPVSAGGLPQWIDFCQTNERTVAMDFSSGKPTDATLYAMSGLLNDRYVIVDTKVVDASASRRFMFFGFAADPDGLTGGGEDCVANIMNLLYRDRPPTPVVSSARR